MMKDWHDVNKPWLDLKSKIPVHILRYEDIRTRPGPVLKGLAEFLIESDISGTRFEQIIDQTLQNELAGYYKPRQALILGNMGWYTEELKDHVKKIGGSLLKDLYPELYLENPSDKIWHFASGQLKEQDNIHANKFIVEFNTKTELATLSEPMKIKKRRAASGRSALSTKMKKWN